MQDFPEAALLKRIKDIVSFVIAKVRYLVCLMEKILT
jgi:hypothetical protein